MKKIIVLLLLLLPMLTEAQNRFIVKCKSKKDEVALPGTTMNIKGSSTSAIADSNGLISINYIAAGTYTLEFSHVGFKKKEIVYHLPSHFADTVVIILDDINQELEEVIVQTTRASRNLRDVLTRIEVIAPEELDEKGTMKPGDIRMLLNESTGITTQQTSAVSGTANIRIQGLDGRYTQVLKDGMPLYTGFSGGLSILQIPPLDLRQVEYIKGSASTLYGGGAISGLVNLITRTPGEKKELSLLLNKNSGKGFDGNGFYAQKWKAIGLTIFSSYNYNGAYDPANIGLTAIPKINRITINPKVFFYFNKHTAAWFGGNTTFENRLGGDLQVIKGKSDSIHQFFEKNTTTRISTQFSLVHIINAFSSINIKNSIGIFDRNMLLSKYNFKARQVSSFSEFNYSYKRTRSEWVIGINEWTERLMPNSVTLLAYNLTTIGLFTQNTFKANNWFSLETGLRADKNTPATKEKFRGIFILPRVNMLFKINEALTSRIGGGLGYKTPSPFIDEAEKYAYQNIRSIDLSNVRTEASYGFNADFNCRKQFEEVKININQFFFYTKLNNPILLESGNYVNANGYLDTKGAETNIKITVDDLSVYTGYTFTDTRQHYNGKNSWQPLSAKHRINFDFTYEIENRFRCGLESFYTGKQQLSDGKTGRDFVTFGLLVQRMWQHLDVFINAENLTDRRQTRFESIYSGTITSPVFNDIYAPLDGVIINGGIKIKL